MTRKEARRMRSEIHYLRQMAHMDVEPPRSLAEEMARQNRIHARSQRIVELRRRLS